MSKISRSLFIIFCCNYVFAQVTLTHNIGNNITVTDIHSCSWGDVFWARSFILADFGINPGNDFIIRSGQVAINPNFTEWDSKIQFNIYSIDEGFPATFNEENLLGSSQIIDVWMTQGPYVTLNFESPVTVPGNVGMILVEVHQLPSSNSSSHLLCSGTNQDNDFSWFRTSNAGCYPFDYKNTVDIAHPNARFYITVSDTAALNSSDFAYNNVKIYPNPARDLLNIEGVSFKSYSLINTMGQIVATGNSTTEISLSNLNAGVYVLALTSANNTVNTYKIIKEYY